MPALDGVGVITEIRRTDPTARVIILTTYDTVKLAHRVTDDPLTERERAVLGLLADGKSNREIGSEIHIEESTVKSHLKSIFAKLHVVSRTEAVTSRCAADYFAGECAFAIPPRPRRPVEAGSSPGCWGFRRDIGRKS